MAESLIFSGLKIYSEQGVLNNARVKITDGKIQEIYRGPATNSSTEKLLDFPESYHLIPGLIDLHVHGANGKDVMDGELDALTTMSSALAMEGVTGFLATTMTTSVEKIERALCVVRDFIHRQDQNVGAAIFGVHLEGPFISPEKIGAQNRENILPCKTDYIERWQKLSGHAIKIVTLAPELSGSAEFIRYLQQQKIIASLGHTNATFAESCEAIAAGCSHVTHLFNAMRGIHQREPGVVTAALLADEVTVEMIVDGIHVHPALVQLVLRMKGKDKLVMVTDAMRAKCMHDGMYELGGQSVEVKDAVARLADGTLAGSTLKMPVALQNIMKFTQCSLQDAVNMAAENPAKILGVFDKKGSIAIGKDADLVVLDENLQVVMTVIGGKMIFKKATMS